jgi:thiol:disulfide interchange protein DsbD
MDGRAGIAVIFEGPNNLHYYARRETASAPGFELIVDANSEDFIFGEAVRPIWDIFVDPLGKKAEVYAGRFTIFVPIKAPKAATRLIGPVDIKISGQACTDIVCLEPFKKTLSATIDYSQADSWKEISFEIAAPEEYEIVEGPRYSVWFALGLAFLAGLSLNIMPCVWPVLPLIIMRIVEQAKESRRRSFAMGLAFCIGILLFFACFAGANIILKSFYGTNLSWGDHLRRPAVVTALALLMVVMALFMFGLFTITVPSRIASKSGTGKGYAGSVGMGLLAAILSTPCSFGILTVAFVWVQGQSLPLGTLAIMVIGLGMALPYAILTLMPGLLGRLPSAGRWMELFKQALGFILLVIAVKLIEGLAEASRVNVLYFAVVLSFSIWMWGSWVTFGTKLSRKLLIRVIAVILVVLAWGALFAPERIEWKSYDANLIAKATAAKRPVLIKFTAGWCTNCKVIDKVVYQRKDIAQLIKQKGVLAIKADTSEQGMPATNAMKNIYKEPGVPVTILLLPGRDEPERFHKIFFAKQLKAQLEKLPSP